jgi:hypothetical protein
MAASLSRTLALDGMGIGSHCLTWASLSQISAVSEWQSPTEIGDRDKSALDGRSLIENRIG